MWLQTHTVTILSFAGGFIASQVLMELLSHMVLKRTCEELHAELAIPSMSILAEVVEVKPSLMFDFAQRQLHNASRGVSRLRGLQNVKCAVCYTRSDLADNQRAGQMISVRRCAHASALY